MRLTRSFSAFFTTSSSNPRQRGLQRDAGGSPPWRALLLGRSDQRAKSSKSLPRQK
jgi:hypothetical protein